MFYILPILAKITLPIFHLFPYFSSKFCSFRPPTHTYTVSGYALSDHTLTFFILLTKFCVVPTFLEIFTYLPYKRAKIIKFSSFSYFYTSLLIADPIPTLTSLYVIFSAPSRHIFTFSPFLLKFLTIPFSISISARFPYCRIKLINFFSFLILIFPPLLQSQTK